MIFPYSARCRSLCVFICVWLPWVGLGINSYQYFSYKESVGMGFKPILSIGPVYRTQVLVLQETEPEEDEELPFQVLLGLLKDGSRQIVTSAAQPGEGEDLVEAAFKALRQDFGIYYKAERQWLEREIFAKQKSGMMVVSDGETNEVAVVYFLVLPRNFELNTSYLALMGGRMNGDRFRKDGFEFKLISEWLVELAQASERGRRMQDVDLFGNSVGAYTLARAIKDMRYMRKPCPCRVTDDVGIFLGRQFARAKQILSSWWHVWPKLE